MSMELEQLLRDTDAQAIPPSDRAVADMASTIRSLARRRRLVRVTSGASVAAALVVLLSVLFAAQPDRGQPLVRVDNIAPPASPDDARLTLASLNAEAEARMAIVERLAAAEQEFGSMQRVPAPDPLLAIRREQDKAAYLLIYEADRLARRSDERQRAAEEYRRVLALFPETHWASLARDRLIELSGSSRGPAVGQVFEDVS